MYESSEIYAIGYDTEDGDFQKVCVLYKSQVRKCEAEDLLEYFKECN